VKKDKGFVLVVVLILIMALSILGVMGMRSAFYQQNIAINNLGYNMVEQASDSIAQYMFDTVRVSTFGDNSLIEDATSSHAYACIDNGIINFDEADCQTKYMDVYEAFKAEAYMINSADDQCVIYDSNVYQISCYKILATGKLGEDSFEANSLSEFSLIEIQTSSHGVYEL
jgi:Tfp pilus assembly protein PilX